MVHAVRMKAIYTAVTSIFAVTSAVLAFPSVIAQASTGTTATSYSLPHRVAAARPDVDSSFYMVQRGDTLSSIARREYGRAARWPALWYINRSRVTDPNVLRVGEKLAVSEWHPYRTWLTAKAMRHIPVPKPPRVVHHAQAASAPPDPAPATTPTAASAPAQPQSYSGAGGYQSCVIARESGGNPSAVNPSSGAGGLYGFLPSTWASLGYPGLPENAPVSEQNAAFAKLYAQQGSAPWVSDGC